VEKRWFAQRATPPEISLTEDVGVTGVL